MTSQAFQEVPKAHALAVALGLIPSLAAWALLLVNTSLQAAGNQPLPGARQIPDPQLYIDGVISLSQGFILSSMTLSAMLVFIIERKFLHAAGWALASAVLSALGLFHAFALTPAGVENKFGFMAARGFAAAYFATACLLAVLHFVLKKEEPPPGSRRAGLGHAKLWPMRACLKSGLRRGCERGSAIGEARGGSILGTNQ